MKKSIMLNLLWIISFLGISCGIPEVKVSKREAAPQITEKTIPVIKEAPAEFDDMIRKIDMTWPQGMSTPSEECGVCHQAIYREYAFGFGSDLEFKGIVYRSLQDKLLNIPSNISARERLTSLPV